MITDFIKFNESIKHLLVGPTEDEIMDNFLKLSPNEMLIKSCKIGSLNGVKIALQRGAKVSYNNFECLSILWNLEYGDIYNFLREKYPPTTEEFFESLIDGIKIKPKKNNFDLKIWSKDVQSTISEDKFYRQVIFQQNTYTKEFLLENDEIWMAFLKVYNQNNWQIKELIQQYIKKYLNLEGYKISFF